MPKSSESDFGCGKLAEISTGEAINSVSGCCASAFDWKKFDSWKMALLSYDDAITGKLNKFVDELYIKPDNYVCEVENRLSGGI